MSSSTFYIKMRKTQSFILRSGRAADGYKFESVGTRAMTTYPRPTTILTSTMCLLSQSIIFATSKFPNLKYPLDVTLSSAKSCPVSQNLMCWDNLEGSVCHFIKGPLVLGSNRCLLFLVKSPAQSNVFHPRASSVASLSLSLSLSSAAGTLTLTFLHSSFLY